MFRRINIGGWLRTALLAAGCLASGTGCVTYWDERNAQAMEQEENQRVLDERLKRMTGQLEGLQMENQRLGTEIENLRHQMESVGQNQSRLMQGQLEELAKRVRALDEARATDRQALLDEISRKVADLINRRPAGGGSSSGGTRTQTPTRRPAGGAETGYEHTVQDGETLSAIAQAYGVKSSAIQQANNISDPTKIRVGQKLFIPQKQ